MPIISAIRRIVATRKGCRVCGRPTHTADGLFCSERHSADYHYQTQYGW